MIGGACLLAAAVAVRFVDDPGEPAVVDTSDDPLLIPQPSVQPVPSEGLVTQG
jgi:hypothetical protein